MKNIKRTKEPKSLSLNKAEWTKKLLNELKSKEWKDVDDSFKKHYKQKDVEEALKAMSGGQSGICFYCETKLGISDYAEIEHYKPKRKFPELSFEWSNLHLSCSKCNKKKGTKWNPENPLIDPCDDDINVRDHFDYELWNLDAQSDRAYTTIQDLYLNDKSIRPELIDARKKVFLEIHNLIRKANDSRKGIEQRKSNDEILNGATKFEYSGMIEYHIKTFLR